jgi:hypothetical protein
MSGLPNPVQITRVVMISRTLKHLQDKHTEATDEIARLKKKIDDMDDSYRTLHKEREKLLESMDVHPNQWGNFGSDRRFAAFLNILCTLNLVGKADEPE